MELDAGHIKWKDGKKKSQLHSLPIENSIMPAIFDKQKKKTPNGANERRGKTEQHNQQHHFFLSFFPP